MTADEPCTCGGCADWRAVHGSLCRELPREEREAQRRLDRDAWRRHEEATVELWGAA